MFDFDLRPLLVVVALCGGLVGLAVDWLIRHIDVSVIWIP